MSGISDPPEMKKPPSRGGFSGTLNLEREGVQRIDENHDTGSLFFAQLLCLFPSIFEVSMMNLLHAFEATHTKRVVDAHPDRYRERKLCSVSRGDILPAGGVDTADASVAASGDPAPSVAVASDDDGGDPDSDPDTDSGSDSDSDADSHPDQRYSLLAKRIANDSRLSWHARGVLLFIIARPVGWRINVNSLVAATANAGMSSRKDSVYRILSELQNVGYITRVQAKGKDGTFKKTVYALAASTADVVEVA